MRYQPQQLKVGIYVDGALDYNMGSRDRLERTGTMATKDSKANVCGPMEGDRHYNCSEDRER